MGDLSNNSYLDAFTSESKDLFGDKTDQSGYIDAFKDETAILPDTPGDSPLDEVAYECLKSSISNRSKAWGYALTSYGE